MLPTQEHKASVTKAIASSLAWTVLTPCEREPEGQETQEDGYLGTECHKWEEGWVCVSHYPFNTLRTQKKRRGRRHHEAPLAPLPTRDTMSLLRHFVV